MTTTTATTATRLDFTGCVSRFMAGSVIFPAVRAGLVTEAEGLRQWSAYDAIKSAGRQADKRTRAGQRGAATASRNLEAGTVGKSGASWAAEARIAEQAATQAETARLQAERYARETARLAELDRQQAERDAIADAKAETARAQARFASISRREQAVLDRDATARAANLDAINQASPQSRQLSLWTIGEVYGGDR